MFTIGQQVETLDGKYVGKVLEIDGDTVYMEQKNGVEVDFSIENLKPYQSLEVKNFLKSFTAKMEELIAENFQWTPVMDNSELGKDSLESKIEILNRVAPILTNDDTYNIVRQKMNQTCNNENYEIHMNVPIDKLSPLDLYNTLLFVEKSSDFMQEIESRKRLIGFAFLGSMVNRG